MALTRVGLVCLALGLAACSREGGSSGQTASTDPTSNDQAAATAPAPKSSTPAAPPSACPDGQGYERCVRALFDAHRSNVLEDFKGAQALEERMWDAISTGDDIAGARLSNDVAGLHKADHDAYMTGLPLGAAVSLPDSEIEALADCANATDSFVGLGVTALSAPADRSLTDAEKERREYVSDARRCEHHFHLRAQSSDLRSHHFAAIDEVGPST